MVRYLSFVMKKYICKKCGCIWFEDVMSNKYFNKYKIPVKLGKLICPMCNNKVKGYIPDTDKELLFSYGILKNPTEGHKPWLKRQCLKIKYYFIRLINRITK